MSQFKTKKLISQIKVIPKKGEIKEKKGFLNTIFSFSQKQVIVSILIIFSAFFLYEAYGRIFSSLATGGSENYKKPSIVEQYISEKVVGTTNILIAGIGGKGHDGTDLTDSIMLASLDGKTKKMTLLSIPRDLYVSYGSGGGAGRINTLYDLGKRDKVGIQYLAQKVTEITGQTIDHHIVIDFSGFKEIIDILGGINIDVPEDLTDREYPDNNWGYLVFSVKKGPQIFDGETALRYARSRHSTSDFDRSNRQQLIIKSIKEKASDLGYITSPEKISDLYRAIISHLDTSLSLASIGNLALSFHDIKSEDISIISLSDSCISLTKCAPGSYLYAPDRERFGGQAVIIPENAQANKLSYYTDIRRFVDMIFHFPELRNETRDIVIISDASMKKRAEEIRYGLAKLGFPLSFEKTLSSSGSIEKSHINIYWHPDISVGIDPSTPRVKALKYIEESIPYSMVGKNEYNNISGPKIEIVIGKDALEYFTFLKNPYYIPILPRPSVSGEGVVPRGILSKKPISSGASGSIENTADEKAMRIIPENTEKIRINEWENF